MSTEQTPNPPAWEEIKPPKTIEDFENVKKEILSLMSNPWCDQFMFLSLSDKLDKTNAKIEELRNHLNS